MWLPNDVTKAVTRLARIHYVSMEDTRLWNAARREGELRLLTGWCWTAKDGSGRHQQGFKTMTVCTRDAYYVLVLKTSVPALSRARLRLVERGAA